MKQKTQNEFEDDLRLQFQFVTNYRHNEKVYDSHKEMLFQNRPATKQYNTQNKTQYRGNF